MGYHPFAKGGISLKKKTILGLLAALVFLAGMVCLMFSPAMQLPATHRHPVSPGVRNIVKNAYQMTEILWTPQKDLVAWDGKFVYEAGVTYKGLPYGQPRDACYVPWQLDLDGFLEVVADPDSKLYTDRASFIADAPYYSCDCSAFVCWSWQLEDHKVTNHVPELVEELAGARYTDVQVGDVLWYPLHHTLMITDILYDKDDEIAAIEISEASAKRAAQYCAARVWFGGDSEKTLEDFEDRYFNPENGEYTLYRLRNPEAVTYTHSCASPLEGDVCEICGYGVKP